MAKVAYKSASAWGWAKPSGKFYPEAFSMKSDAVEYFESNGYAGKLTRVWVVPYKAVKKK